MGLSLHVTDGAEPAPRYLVPGLARGVDILRLFDRERPSIAAPAMARELGIPRSTVFRLAQTLEWLGLLERTDGGRAYKLGVGVLSLGFEYLASLDVAQIGAPVLAALRDRTSLAAHLVIRDGEEVVVVHRCPGLATFSSALDIGKRLPAHATVLGRATLMHLDLGELTRVYGPGRQLPGYSPQTPRTVAALADLLAVDAGRGYCLSEGFFEDGISSVAAPVRDTHGKVVAGINVTVHETGGQRLDEALIRAVCEAAGEISAALNYRPPGDASNQPACAGGRTGR